VPFPKASIVRDDHPARTPAESDWDLIIALVNAGRGAGNLYWVLQDRETRRLLETVDGRGPWFATYITPGESFEWTETYKMPDKEKFKLRKWAGHWENGEFVYDETWDFRIERGKPIGVRRLALLGALGAGFVGVGYVLTT